MGRMYTASFTNVAVSAAQDLFEINAAADTAVVLHRVHIGQSSDEADAQAEMLRIQINRASGTAGSGGTTPTENPMDPGDAAFGGSVEANNTTQAGTQTTILAAEAFNVQAGFFHVPTPEERITIPGQGILTVNLIAAPADALTMEGTITFEEIG